MKAVGYRKSLPVTDKECLLDPDIPAPVPGPRDLLVEVRAVSVNPVDTKVRKRAEPRVGEMKILGYDLADKGAVRTTIGKNFGRITAANMIQAHALVESGRAIGKAVLEGF